MNKNFVNLKTVFISSFEINVIKYLYILSLLIM